jgi:hypothetical protein
MTTNPRWQPNVPSALWNMFATEAEANEIILDASAAIPNASLGIDAEVTAIYSPPPDNPDNVQPFSIVGTTPNGNPVLEFAGDLFDRKTKPDDGIDQYPLVEPVELYYKVSEQGLAWRHKAD